MIALLWLTACERPIQYETWYPPEDTAVEAPGLCEQTVGAGGTVVGTRSCADGRCLVEAGEFVMGAPTPEQPDRCPERRVSLHAFAIDETEVTAAAWADCVDAGACEAPPSCPSQADHASELSLPIACVDWEQASAYCAWAGGRLPTEAEWEKAARGEDGATWAWGDRPPTCFTANFRFSVGYCEGGAVEVGRYAEPDPAGTDLADTRSAAGLLDVVGNVWEWTADWYDAGWYADAPTTDPPGPERCRDQVGVELGDCRFKVLRGGGFNSTEDATGGAVRSYASPEVWDDNIGLRCAYDL